jgi:heme exporter protein CcmB
MQIFWIVFYHELVLSFRHLGKIFANFLFFLISVAIFFLLSQNQDNQGSAAFYSITIIWFSLLSCLIFSSAEFLKRDFDDGTIEQILTSTENFEVFVLAKMLANWLICCVPILISIFPIGAAIALDQALMKNLIVMILLATIAINFICSFCGSLSILGNSAPMIAVIALPLIIPILLISYSGVTSETSANLNILLGLCIFIGSISVFATAKIVRIAAE